MNAEPWKKWTPESVRGLCMPEQPLLSEALKAFAALLEAEQRGERCVLPMEVAELEGLEVWSANGKFCVQSLESDSTGDWCATQEAAILDLARKLRSR